MDIFRRTSFKISWLLAAILAVTCCVTISDGDKPEWNFKTAAERLKAHPLPATYIVFNDYQLGWLYNKGERFSDDGFKTYVSGLAITERCKEVRFIYGINRHNREYIRYAILYL